MTLNREQLKCLSKGELIALACRKPVALDDADVRALLRHTLARLTTLRARAREGKCVDEASEFARWVLSSGLDKVCASVGASDELRRLVTDTQADCEAFWKREPRGPWVAKSELEALNARLDAIAVLLTHGQGEPVLRVVEGE